MEEHRKSLRGRTYLGGQITFNERSSTMDCLVRNLSQDGARILLPSTVGVPHEFELTVHGRNENFLARLIWRTPTEIGVAISRPVEPSFVSVDAACRIKRLEADRDALARRVAQLSEPVC